ncbi:hypothetical protein NLB33_35290 [Mycolicibacterium smegmatis]|uniref:hypothetical protein n=1 Tax=Mycolicibacterium smegmatis TaxID=1772 RepID=UPI0020A538B8|nr:hypothetical protein [Mycolicibacterium smegmatis]MCP2628117.1 hypothetical protein [Mycolicibacterium smegmatis]
MTETTTNPDPDTTPRRRWVKPAMIAVAAVALIGGGVAVWSVSRPADPEPPPAAVYHSGDYNWSEEELEPWLQEQVSSGFLTPLPDAVAPAPAPCAENADTGLCRLSEIMREEHR